MPSSILKKDPCSRGPPLTEADIEQMRSRPQCAQSELSPSRRLVIPRKSSEDRLAAAIAQNKELQDAHSQMHLRYRDHIHQLQDQSNADAANLRAARAEVKSTLQGCEQRVERMRKTMYMHDATLRQGVEQLRTELAESKQAYNQLVHSMETINEALQSLCKE